MSDKPTGGPAFPSKQRIMRSGYATQEFEPVNGMTLRDYFAAKAMQSLIQKYSHESDVSRNAYLLADAMLRAKDK